MSVVQLPARTTLGGSDAAAAAGIDPYRSRVMLWLEKTGRVERAETEAMQWGKRLEGVIMDVLVDDDGWVAWQQWPDGVTDPERPWLVGHPDGAYEYDTENGTTWGLLEIKTANAWAHAANGDLPIQYAAQAQVYLHLTGLRQARVVTLVAGQRLEVRDVTYSPHAVELLLGRMEDFLGFVQRDEPPPPDASESSREALRVLYPQHEPGKVYRLTGAEWKAARELRARREQRDAIDAKIREHENVVKAAAGYAETIITPHDTTFATWKTVTSRRLDSKRLRDDHPDLYADYSAETTTRRFLLA